MKNLYSTTCIRAATLADLDQIVRFKIESCIDDNPESRSTMWLIDLFKAALKNKISTHIQAGSIILMLTSQQWIYGTLSYSIHEKTAAIDNISLARHHNQPEILEHLLKQSINRIQQANYSRVTIYVCNEDHHITSVLSKLGFQSTENSINEEVEYVRNL